MRPTVLTVSFSAMCTNFQLVKEGSMASGMNGVVNAIIGDWQTSGRRDVKGRISADGSSSNNQNPLAWARM